MEATYEIGLPAGVSCVCDYEEFTERIMGIVCEESEQMYRECCGRSWDMVETVIRDRLTLKNIMKPRQRRSEDYMELLNNRGVELFTQLKKTRQGLAMRAGYPPYIVFSNRTLFGMCVRQPSDEAEMEELYGAGERSVRRFGDAFLRNIRSFNGGSHIETRSDEFIEKGEEGYPLIFGSRPKTGSIFDRLQAM
ncbi:MAG: HRDC domain-containing protein [Lachnospiraceae bacterium]|nr:HRDC domain-containing protein [Lachnospiraceae bacterium]